MYKKLFSGLVGIVAALSIGAAGAYFTAQVQVADSVIKAGSVEISAEPTTAPLSINALAPGTTAVRQLKVSNTGALPATVVVSSSKKAGITEFYDALGCRASSGGIELYSGPLSGLKTAALRTEPGASVQYDFEVSLPASATNTLADDYARVSLYVDAEQVH